MSGLANLSMCLASCTTTLRLGINRSDDRRSDFRTTSLRSGSLLLLILASTGECSHEVIPMEHCIVKICEIADRPTGDARSIFQLGYNLGRLSELTALGRS